MAKLDELKQEAKELGITYSAQIGEKSLQAKIDAYYKAQETSGKEIQKAIEDNEKKGSETTSDTDSSIGALARNMEAKARKTRVVTIVDNDQRVNNQTTSCTVNCGNEWFDLGQMILPLNVPVEVMQGHIDVLKEIEIPLHVKDTHTGLSKVEMRKRYNISYEDVRA